MKGSSGKRSVSNSGKSVPIFSELERKDWMVILLITVYIITFFKPVVSGDGFGYHAMLEGVFKDHTINLTDQQRYNNISGMEIVKNFSETSIYNTHFFFGLPFLSSPIYVSSLFLDDFGIFNIKDAFFLEERGDILIRLASIPVTSVLIFYMGLFACFFLLKRYFSRDKAWIAILIMFFSSPLIRYAAYDLSYTQAIETGLMCILIFLFFRDSRKEYMGIILGLLSTIHYYSILFSLPFFVYYFYKKRKCDALRIFAWMLPFLVSILIYNSIIFGGPLTTGYDEHLAESGLFIPVHVNELFFDMDRGIIFWTPAVLLSLFGLFFMKGDKRYVLILLFLLQVYVQSSILGWHSAWGFGQRHFTMFFPIYCIGLVRFFENRPKIRYIFYILTIYTILMYFAFLAYPPIEYVTGSSISAPDYWAHLASPGDLSNLPGMVFKKIGMMRFIFET